VSPALPDVLKGSFCVALLGIVLCGSASLSEESALRHDLTCNVLPWKSERFDAAEDKFTFAVFSDLTGGEREGIFAIAVAQLNLLRPELIINVGDLIEGGTEDPGEAGAQWDSFDDRAAKAKAPIFYVGGNHDLTGSFLQGVWDQRNGRRYYHFIYKDVQFLVLDTEDNTPERMQEIFEARNEAMEVAKTEGWDAFDKTEYASMPEQAAGNISDEQSSYFRDIITTNPNVRWTFLFMHKAPWLREDLDAFVAIEDALADRPYTVFNGHQHTYELTERHGRDYIRLATTGGVQFPERGPSMDHVTLVTVSETGVDIANLRMDGILDKTGHIPSGGDDICFEAGLCGEKQE